MLSRGLEIKLGTTSVTLESTGETAGTGAEKVQVQLFVRQPK